MKQQFLKAKTDTIRLTIYENNRPLIPSSSKVTLYGSAGSELQAQASASVDGTTGEMTYSITAIHTADHDLNYKAIWEYVVSGTTYYETQLFDVVKSILSIPITDDDIFNELESLRETNKQATGTATAGTSSTLVDTVNRKESDSYWKGGFIEILSGTGSGQRRDITAFTQSTSTVTVTPDFATTPDTTSVYKVEKSFTNKISQSFEKVETLLYNKGQRHSLVLESSQIKFPLLYLVVHNICLDLISEPNDKWSILAEQYWTKFDNSFSNMKVDYDADESGSIDGEEEQRSVSEFRVGRS